MKYVLECCGRYSVGEMILKVWLLFLERVETDISQLMVGLLRGVVQAPGIEVNGQQSTVDSELEPT